LIHPREAFRDAIRESAASVIFVHNHPSGDPSPSREDIAITERLVNVGDIVGIKVLDHVIIGDGTYTSMMEKGYINSKK
jgi:DNA repair protein RadC